MISSISKLEISEREEEAKDGSEDTHKIRVEVDQCSKDAHMLVIGTNFIPTNSNRLASMLYEL